MCAGWTVDMTTNSGNSGRSGLCQDREWDRQEVVPPAAGGVPARVRESRSVALSSARAEPYEDVAKRNRLKGHTRLVQLDDLGELGREGRGAWTCPVPPIFAPQSDAGAVGKL